MARRRFVEATFLTEELSEFGKLKGMRNEMIVSSFIYVSLANRERSIS